MSDIGARRATLVRRLLDGEGQASASERGAAFRNSGLTGPAAALVDKVALHAWQVTDEDIAAVKASGLREDQIFEMVVCAAVGQAARQYDAAVAALEAATGKE